MLNLVQPQTSGRSAAVADNDALPVGASSITVHLCGSDIPLEAARRFRYEIYCGEMGRNPPSADHDRRTISDALDDLGHTFVAVENGGIIGTLRGNFSRDGGLGDLEEPYGMRGSPHHPHSTTICTKFIVKRSRRGSQASGKLIAAMIRLGLERDAKACFIECVTAHLPYYAALGFEVSGPGFVNADYNTRTHPMVLDLEEHGRRLAMDKGVRDYLKTFARNGGRARDIAASAIPPIAA